MQELKYLDGVPQYTLEHFERDFADRHLLHGAVEKWARETPDAVAIEVYDTGATFTYSQFDRVTTGLALSLLERGLRKGDYLATMLPLLAEHIFLEYACFKIGVIVAPLDLRLKAPEVIRSLGLVKPRVFACLGQTPVMDFRPLVEEVRDACGYLESIVQFAPPGATIEGATSAFELAASAASYAADPSLSPAFLEFQNARQDIRETDGALVIYTTGSTGLPKPALLSHRNISSQNMCLGGGFRIDQVGKMLVNLPPSHVGCQTEQLMTTFFLGSTAVIMHVFDPEKTLDAVQKHRVEGMGQIPAMFNFQWRLPNFDQYDLSSLKFVLYGGQQVTRPFLEKLRTMAPQFGTGLGLTELAGFCTYSRLDGTVDDILASVGYDMPVTPLSIRKPMRPDGYAGDELPDGEVGEICFSGPQVLIGYVNNDEAYAKTVSKDGVCYTGDLGSRTPKGLQFAGRSKLVIKPKGYQVHPAQIEEHFAQLPEVAVCGAVGVHHELFSEGVMLFVERKPDHSLTVALLEEHSKRIAAYMRPSHYVLLDPLKFPFNRVAKTDYVALKQQAEAIAQALRAVGKWDR